MPKTYPCEDKNSVNNDDKVLLNKCLHDIKNYKKLSPEILSAINRFSYEDRLLVLSTYNDVVTYLESVVFNIHS